MKLLIIAAAMTLGGAAVAQTPLDDGRDIHGHDPDGQPFTPAGFNAGLSAYPSATAAPPALIGGDYPACSAGRTDRCVQTYTKMTERGTRAKSPKRAGRR